ncbi:YkyA family protein [Staphylococcus sp. IVB6181]|uniref:YkyA family protein n=1 Tax=Staphylococcus sp. IVB6181 TaxID=2929481 RepID=UPI0021D1BD35|nr:YkyA family protein [Staphylococcus sp. IVB6181]UXV34283.1 YkyA family protein [Staphylococcus sp. IVB6181]
MKVNKTLGLVIASSLLLGACTTDSHDIKEYNKTLKQAVEKENTAVKVGEKLNKLTNEKNDLAKKINGKDTSKVVDTSKKIVNNINQREDEFKKEEQAFDASEKKFEEAKKKTKDLRNKKRKEAIEKTNEAVEKNYKAHDDYAKAYKNSLDKEKDLFEYIVKSNGQANQSQIDEKTKAIDDSYKDVNKKIKAYSKTRDERGKQMEAAQQIK